MQVLELMTGHRLQSARAGDGTAILRPHPSRSISSRKLTVVAPERPLQRNGGGRQHAAAFSQHARQPVRSGAHASALYPLTRGTRSMGALINEARDEADEEFWGQAAFAEVRFRFCSGSSTCCPRALRCTLRRSSRGADRARRFAGGGRRRIRFGGGGGGPVRQRLRRQRGTWRAARVAVAATDAARAQEEDDDDEGGDDEPKCVACQP